MESACTSEKCVYHDINETVIEDLKNAVKVLLDGQQDLKLSVIQLTEAFKSMDRIESKVDKLEEVFSLRLNRVEDDMKAKLDKLEDRQKELDKEQDAKIGEVRGFMYKVSGALAVLTAIAPILLKFVGI